MAQKITSVKYNHKLVNDFESLYSYHTEKRKFQRIFIVKTSLKTEFAGWKC